MSVLLQGFVFLGFHPVHLGDGNDLRQILLSSTLF